MRRDYILNENANILFDGIEILSVENVVQAMEYANEALRELNDSTKRLTSMFSKL